MTLRKGLLGWGAEEKEREREREREREGGGGVRQPQHHQQRLIWQPNLFQGNMAGICVNFYPCGAGEVHEAGNVFNWSS